MEHLTDEQFEALEDWIIASSVIAAVIVQQYESGDVKKSIASMSDEVQRKQEIAKRLLTGK